MLSNLTKQMVTRVSTVDTVITIAIKTFREVLVGLNQSFCVIKGIHRMNIVICRSVA